jgi:DNA-binding transcriptional LysR family regulator
MLPRFYVEERLRDGSLVEVLPEWSLPEAGVWALWPTREHVPAKVRRFLEILASR